MARSSSLRARRSAWALRRSDSGRTTNGQVTDLELRIYTATVIGEAGGEGVKGMAAVAWVIRNRVLNPGWPNGVVGVCLEPLQFSFWNGDSKRRAAVLMDESEVFRRAQKVCINVWTGASPDATGGATHYHSVTIRPPWASALRHTTTIRNHVFYSESRAQ